MKINYDTHTCTALAKKFSEILKGYIGEKQLLEVVRRNDLPEYSKCCASHDFCDANIVMEEAWNSLFKKEHDLQDSFHLAIWNDAWTTAKEMKFYTKEIVEQ